MSDLIAGEFFKSEQVKIVWKGIVPATNDLYLAYDKSKVTSQMIEEIRGFAKQSINHYKTE